MRRNWSEDYYTSSDGLRLYARHYPAAEDLGRLPVLCLPGLTRNSRDFHSLASHLSGDAEAPRDVYCIDYRGRGNSEYDKNWRNYTPFTELLDTLDFMTVAGLHETTVIGTSRGGIIAMMMAVMRPAALRTCVLNDIGPLIETAGLARIIGYVGKIPVPETWDDAARIVRTMSEQFFTDIDADEWEAIARQIFADVDGVPRADYDASLARVMAEIDLSERVPDMWPQFEALEHIPTLVIRGENSDLLSEETVREMAARHPRLNTHTVAEQGHPPLLRDLATLRVITGFLNASEPPR